MVHKLCLTAFSCTVLGCHMSCVMLCCAVLRYAVLCYALICLALLCYADAMLCSASLYYAVLCRAGMMVAAAHRTSTQGWRKQCQVTTWPSCCIRSSSPAMSKKMNRVLPEQLRVQSASLRSKYARLSLTISPLCCHCRLHRCCQVLCSVCWLSCPGYSSCQRLPF